MSNSIFICEQCWRVWPETCPTCPDRGSGRGVTVQKIKDDLRSCQKIADVNATAVHYARHVELLDAQGGSALTMAIQIRDLAKSRRLEFYVRD